MIVYEEIPSPTVPTYESISDFASFFLVSIGSFLKISSSGDRLKVSSTRGTPEYTEIQQPSIPTYTEITQPS